MVSYDTLDIVCLPVYVLPARKHVHFFRPRGSDTLALTSADKKYLFLVIQIYALLSYLGRSLKKTYFGKFSMFLSL